MFGKMYLNMKKDNFLKVYLSTWKMLKQSHHLQNNDNKKHQECEHLNNNYNNIVEPTVEPFKANDDHPKNIVQNEFV